MGGIVFKGGIVFDSRGFGRSPTPLIGGSSGLRPQGRVEEVLGRKSLELGVDLGTASGVASSRSRNRVRSFAVASRVRRTANLV